MPKKKKIEREEKDTKNVRKKEERVERVVLAVPRIMFHMKYIRNK